MQTTVSQLGRGASLIRCRSRHNTGGGARTASFKDTEGNILPVSQRI